MKQLLYLILIPFQCTHFYSKPPQAEPAQIPRDTVTVYVGVDCDDERETGAYIAMVVLTEHWLKYGNFPRSDKVIKEVMKGRPDRQERTREQIRNLQAMDSLIVEMKSIKEGTQ